MCARRRSNFLLSRQEKVTKEKATLLRASPSLRYGATCDARSGGATAELAARLRRSVQTTVASQFTKHGRCDAHAHPATAPPQAQPAGVGQPNIQTAGHPNSPTGHCFARPPLAGASATRCAGWAERSNGPCGCPFPGFPSVRAEKRRAGGACVCRRTHALRALTCRSCLNGARSAQ